jgi:hypothetical protein
MRTAKIIVSTVAGFNIDVFCFALNTRRPSCSALASSGGANGLPAHKFSGFPHYIELAVSADCADIDRLGDVMVGAVHPFQ